MARNSANFLISFWEFKFFIVDVTNKYTSAESFPY